MQNALPPPRHYALCNLAERIEVASRKPCCRSFAELSANTAEGTSCWQGSCALIEGDHPKLKFQPKPCRDACGTPQAKDRARTCMGSNRKGTGFPSTKHYAIHNCGSPDYSVAARLGYQLYDGRGNPCVAGDCAGHGAGQLHFRAETIGLRKLVIEAGVGAPNHS